VPARLLEMSPTVSTSIPLDANSVSMLQLWIKHVSGNARQLAGVLQRLGTIVVAYMAASLVSGLVIALAVLLSMLAKMLYAGNWQEAATYTLTGPAWLIMFGFVASLAVAGFAFLPAMLVIGLAEALRVRSAAFYGSWGAIAAIVSFSVFIIREGHGSRASPDWTVGDVAYGLVLVAAGAIGGLAYWTLAGANAGNWREPGTKPAIDRS